MRLPCYQSLDLQQYPEQNREDIRTYIDNSLTPYHLTEEQFCQRLTDASENNFMYLSQFLPGIANNIYPQPFHGQPLPPGLETYYQSHLARMKDPDLSTMELALLRLLAQEKQPLSVETIATAINEDEYDVEEALEKWREFFIEQLIDGEIHYRLYHSNFQEWFLTQISDNLCSSTVRK